MDKRIVTGALLTMIFCLATSAWAGTWMDDFNDGNLDGWQKADIAVDLGVVKEGTGKVEEKEGKLIVTDNADVGIPNGGFPTFAGFNNGQNTKDFTLTVDAQIAKVTIPEDCWWFIQFRSGSDSFAINFYTVVGGTAGFAISEIRTNFPNPNYIGIVESPFVFEIDKWYHIELSMKGSQAKAWVDKKLMWQADWKDQPAWLPESGGFYLGGWGMELHLDNFVLTSDDVPDVTPVNLKGKLPITWAKLKYAR
ncbi:hypothetical protein FJZ31_17990 [Candidatus Poribacteria bacterium]|nr:hypothetical protein [Candidatus Poribacteria bacterium]